MTSFGLADSEEDLEQYVEDSEYGGSDFTFAKDVGNGVMMQNGVAETGNDGKTWSYKLCFN